MDSRAAVIVAARRTPVISVPADPVARQRFLMPHELAAPVLAALAGDISWAADRIDDVVIGCARGPGGDVARVAALAGLGVEVAGVSVDRQCGSGLEAIRIAAALVGSGVAEVVLAGGVESASTGPSGRAAFAPAGFADPEMGCAAEDLARQRGISRPRQDAYALRSHRLSVAAIEEGVFDAELVPVLSAAGVAGVTRDDRPRPRMTRGLLARFPAAFAEGGSVTAGNSCGVSDGAAAVAVVSEEIRHRLGVPGLRVLDSAVAGVDPALPGLGPVPAVRDLLSRNGLSLGDTRVLEITEAFAAQVLACTDELGIEPFDPEGVPQICPQGGAIGLGHPWGASGALLAVRLFAELVRAPAPDGALGIATCAVGGGQGIAVLVQRVA